MNGAGVGGWMDTLMPLIRVEVDGCLGGTKVASEEGKGGGGGIRGEISSSGSL